MERWVCPDNVWASQSGPFALLDEKGVFGIRDGSGMKVWLLSDL